MTTTRWITLLLALSVPAVATADIVELARCQKSIARQGAAYAQRVIKASLDCTVATANCQIQCEQGVFGPSCDPVPAPGCCDANDPSSNPVFGACMASAQAVCDAVTLKLATFETKKQTNITKGCALVTQEELCGTQAVGLNFEALNAGCLALDPTYTCNLTNLLNCVGGPLERQIIDQISTLLQPRATDAVTALGLQATFPDIPTTRKVVGTVPEGRADVWALTGNAGDQVSVHVNTMNDSGSGTSSVHPALILLEADLSPTPNVTTGTQPCSVPNVCGSGCPQIKRRLPYSGTYYAAVAAATGDSCAGGGYKLIVTSPTGAVPMLVQDNVDASAFFGP